MSIGEKLVRRAFERPLPDPYREEPGYRQPDAIDPTGYSASDQDPRAGARPAGDGEISDVRFGPGDVDHASAGTSEQHAWRRTPAGQSDVYTRRGLDGGGHRLAAAPLEYTADRDTLPRSDSDVYRDVYGAGEHE